MISAKSLYLTSTYISEIAKFFDLCIISITKRVSYNIFFIFFYSQKSSILLRNNNENGFDFKK